MVMILVLMTVLCFILLILLLCCAGELSHLSHQLEHIEKGSCIELTTRFRMMGFLDIYRRLNRILSAGRAQELEQLRAQNLLKQTITGMAHDIRTPLTSAAGYLQMLEDVTKEENQLRYEHIIKKRLSELKDMLEQMFLYTKLTGDDFHLECRDTAVFPVLSDSLVSMYHLFEEKNIQPQVTFADETLHVAADIQALNRIFRNLIHNALLHGCGNLFITQADNCIRFANIMESEPGQDLRDNPSQIFDRFYKADQARRKGSSGLGLTIVKELMAQMGGRAKAQINGNLLTITLTFCSGRS